MGLYLAHDFMEFLLFYKLFCFVIDVLLRHKSKVLMLSILQLSFSNDMIVLVLYSY
jgi:hypothetical protein